MKPGTNGSQNLHQAVDQDSRHGRTRGHAHPDEAGERERLVMVAIAGWDAGPLPSAANESESLDMGAASS
jgi:hypothetical protein